MKRTIPLAFLALLFAGCSNPPKGECNARSCSDGCCDATGVCQRFSRSDACGTGGAACVACGTGERCNEQNVCAPIPPATGGGGGGGTGGGAGGGGVTPFDAGIPVSGAPGVAALTAACSDLIAPYCQYLVRCGFAESFDLCTDSIARSSDVANYAPDNPANLFDIRVRACTDHQYRLAVESGRMQFDPTAMRNCLQALANAPCDRAVLTVVESDTAAQAGPFATSCRSALVAAVEPGGVCTLDDHAECRSGTYCNAAGGSVCPATCEPLIPGGADAGMDPFVICEPGYYWYDEDGDDIGLCVPRADAGESCSPLGTSSTAQQCDEGYFCDENEECQPRRGRDAGCIDDDSCQADLFCVRIVGQSDPFCQPLPGLGRPSALSSAYFNVSGCKAPLFYDFSSPYECVAPRGAGFTCNDATSNYQCLTPFYCDGVACQPKLPPGSACAGIECDQTSYCDSALRECVLRGGADAGCTADEACQRGLTCGSVSGVCEAPLMCP